MAETELRWKIATALPAAFQTRINLCRLKRIFPSFMSAICRHMFQVRLRTIIRISN
jgi:hypothetical protein